MKGLVEKMEAKDIKHLVLAVAALLCGTWGYSEYLEHQVQLHKKEQTTKREQLDAQVRQNYHNKLHELMMLLAQQRLSEQAQASIQKFADALQDGNQSIVRSVSDAQSIRIAQQHWDRQQIVEASSRRTRNPERATAQVDIAPYYIHSINTESPDIIRLGLTDTRTNDKLLAHWIRENISTEDMNGIWNASRDNLPIMLEVNRQLRGDTLERATVTMVRRDLEPHLDSRDSFKP